MSMTTKPARPDFLKRTMALHYEKTCVMYYVGCRN